MGATPPPLCPPSLSDSDVRGCAEVRRESSWIRPGAARDPQGRVKLYDQLSGCQGPCWPASLVLSPRWAPRAPGQGSTATPWRPRQRRSTRAVRPWSRHGAGRAPRTDQTRADSQECQPSRRCTAAAGPTSKTSFQYVSRSAHTGGPADRGVLEKGRGCRAVV